MLQIHVSEDCQHYAQCVLEAPGQFRLGEDGLLQYAGVAADEALVDVEAAADVCPMRAISIVAGWPS
ncbi:MAG: ferredoxin [Pseudonocardiales bacterium]|nr:MAG: ferredoxin [Pseudonocardiales bacterium]